MQKIVKFSKGLPRPYLSFMILSESVKTMVSNLAKFILKYLPPGGSHREVNIVSRMNVTPNPFCDRGQIWVAYFLIG